MNGYYGGAYGNMMSGGGSWLLMLLGGLFFFILIVGGIALFIWALSKTSRSGNGTQTNPLSDEACLAILKKRYASGDIDKKQFEEMKKDCHV